MQCPVLVFGWRRKSLLLCRTWRLKLREQYCTLKCLNTWQISETRTSSTQLIVRTGSSWRKCRFGIYILESMVSIYPVNSVSLENTEPIQLRHPLSCTVPYYMLYIFGLPRNSPISEHFYFQIKIYLTWGRKHFFLVIWPVPHHFSQWHYGVASNFINSLILQIFIERLYIYKIYGIGSHNYGGWEIPWFDICKLDT